MTNTYFSTQKDSNQLSLTIYNNGFGVVKDTRAIGLTPESDTFCYMDVAALIETDSLLIKGVKVHELNYDYDLVSKVKLLEKYMDRTVYLKKSDGSNLECRLLSVKGGLVLENTGSKELYLDPQEELILPKLPDGLIVKPTLVWKIPPQHAEELKVSYLTAGFQWAANYVMELQGDSCNLIGWVNVNNQSGATYENAKLKLLAGDVNRAGSRYEMIYSEKSMYIADSAAEPHFDEKSFADYHLYTLNQPVTIKDNQSKQIQFFQADQVPCSIFYKCSTRDEKASVIVEIRNDAESRLGIPLPKGKVKAYQRDDEDGELEFVGEDEIGHTPKNEQVLLKIGEAFDIVCEHEVKERKKNIGISLETHSVWLRNHKEQPAEIRLSHQVYQYHYEVIQTSHPTSFETANEIGFVVQVPANGSVHIEFKLEFDESYTVRIEKK